MALKSLSIDKIAQLKHLANAGDLLAQAAVESMQNETALASIGAGLIAGGTPAAKSANSVHAAIRGDTSIANVTTGLANPVTPRNLRVAFGAAHWDGGDVIAIGTDQFGAAVTETFTSTPGSTVVGVKIFATVTSLHHTVLGTDSDAANTYTVGTGDKIGVLLIPHTGSPVLLTVDGVGEAVTFDAATNAFTPTTVPNASHVYVLIVNL